MVSGDFGNDWKIEYEKFCEKNFGSNPFEKQFENWYKTNVNNIYTLIESTGHVKALINHLGEVAKQFSNDKKDDLFFNPNGNEITIFKKSFDSTINKSTGKIVLKIASSQIHPIPMNG